MTFQPGVVTNPKGRPVGSKNKITLEFHRAVELADQKYPHPYLQMAEWANDPTKPLEIRAVMLKECASYRCVKPKQTIGIQSEVPVFQSEDQAESFLAQFISDLAPDLEPLEVAAMTKQWIESKRAGQELELKVNPPEVRPQQIQIVGGLPTPPGCENLIMPDINGHQIDAIESVASVVKTQHHYTQNPCHEDSCGKNTIDSVAVSPSVSASEVRGSSSPDSADAQVQLPRNSNGSTEP
jgi:hypothetical protein